MQPNDKPINTIIVTADELNIRKGPGPDHEKIGTYKEGDTVDIYEIQDGWGRTNKGWIKMEYVNTNATSVNGNGNNNQDNKDNTTAKPDITSNGSTTVILKGVVKVADLNLRSKGSTTVNDSAI